MYKDTDLVISFSSFILFADVDIYHRGHRCREMRTQLRNEGMND